jgi:hypothetical protein
MTLKIKILLSIFILILISTSIWFYCRYSTSYQSQFLINYSPNNIKLKFNSQDISIIRITSFTGETKFEFSKDDFDLITQYIKESKQIPLYSDTNMMPMNYDLYIILKDDRYMELVSIGPYFMYMDKSHYQHRIHMLFESKELSSFIEERLNKK